MRVFDARRTDAVLLVVALVWGSSYLSARTAVSALPVPTVLFARYALAALACLALVAVRRGRRRWTREEVRAGVPLGLTQAAVLVIETYGVAHTSAANAGLIISLTMVLTPLLDRSGHPGGLPWTFHTAAGVCVLAVGLLMSGNGFHAPGLGDLLMLGAACVRAAHMALVGRLTAGRAVRPLHLTALQTLVGTVLFLPPAATRLPGSISPCSAVCSPSSPRRGRSSARPPAVPDCCSAPSRSGPSRWVSSSAATVSLRSPGSARP
jgi:drug/metabolite transporter (DMT)-like permease